jgi:protein gp37
MGTGISYVDETWNPVVGCKYVSEGCRNCYAARVAHRAMCEQHRGLTDEHGRWTGEVRLVPEALEKPLRWRKPRRVLTPSMGDYFQDDVPDVFLERVFATMEQARASTFLVLTKRIADALQWLRERKDMGPIPNVLIGCTVENQRRADERLPVLAEIAEMKWRTWVSVEPLLGHVDIDVDHCPRCGRWHGVAPCSDRPRPEFVAVGAETGSGARPCEVGWIRSVVQQCETAGIRCHVKQLDSRGKAPGEGWPRELVGVGSCP